MRKTIGLVTAIFLLFGCIATYATEVTDGGFEINPTEKIFQVGNPIYRVNGNVLSNLAADDVINMTLQGKWVAEAQPGLIAVCVLQNDKGTAKAMSYGQPKDLGENLFSFDVSLIVPEALNIGKYSVNTYLWHGIQCKKIYTEGYNYCEDNNKLLRNTKWAGISGTLSLSSEEKYRGLSSLMIKSSKSNLNSTATLETTVPAEGVWKLNFAAKGNSAFAYDVTTTDGVSLMLDGEKTFTTSPDWVIPDDGIFDTGANDTIKIMFKDKALSGTSWVDNVYLDKTLLKADTFDINANAVSKSFTVPSDRVYTVKFDTKGADCSVYVKQNGKIIAHKTVAANTTAASLDFYASEINTEYVIFSKSQVQINNLTVTQATSDIVVNGDFENNSSTPWYIRNEQSGNKLEMIAGKNGSYGVKLIKRRDVFNGIEQNIATGLNKFGLGKYKISGYVRFNGATELGEISVKVMTQKSPQKLYTLSPISNVKNEWVYFEEILDIAQYGADSTLTSFSDTAVLFVNSTKGTFDLCIDDIKMEALGRNPKPPVYTEIQDESNLS